ncbi:MAG: hypothetical protein PHI31_17315 [Desulfuromonadaceae bacterium]|nr:hypothetical protein [Desulfuromonadaceae bacterium]
MKTLLLSSVVSLVLFGCGPHTLTQAEWAAMTTHTFPNRSVNEVLQAGAKVADRNRANLSYTDTSMTVIRQYDASPVLVGSIEYTLTAVAINRRFIKTTLSVRSSEGGEVFLPPYKELYDMYFARMEYLLYNTKVWPTCDDNAYKNAAPYLRFALCNGTENDIPVK